ncbi:MAG: caspase family protein [Planctomycetaceae bacterium]
MVAILTLLSPVVHAAEHYALLVGVRQYDPAQMTSLRYTENDANQLAAVLGNSEYANEHLVLMTQTRGAVFLQLLPASKQIRRQLNLLRSEVAADDTLLIAFSGHGIQFKDEDSIYFCAMEADLSDRSSLISLTDVYRLLPGTTASYHYRDALSFPADDFEGPSRSGKRSWRLFGKFLRERYKTVLNRPHCSPELATLRNVVRTTQTHGTFAATDSNTIRTGP